MASYYTENRKHYPAKSRALLEAIAGHPLKAATSEEIAAAVPSMKPDNIRNLLVRLRSRLYVISHGRPQVWVLTQPGHSKLEWYRKQDPALDGKPAPAAKSDGKPAPARRLRLF